MSASNSNFPVVAQDPITAFTKPQQLYGREQAEAALMASFARICSGQGEVVLVPGYSGVGKTALVQALKKPVRNQNGFFLQGKFNQYQQNIPYFAVRQAMTELACELCAEEEPLRGQWKNRIQQAVGELGRLLVDLVPEFNALLGPQPAVAEISHLEAQYRFVGMLRKVFNLFCRAEHPVVLFIDDWQWADSASFELLKQLQIGTTLHYLLVIAPYRDNEVDQTHPLLTTVEALRSQAVPVSVIEIRNLVIQEVLAWVKNLLQPAVESPEALAQLIYERTLGNPFFTQALLAFLRDFGLLYFDQLSNCWLWQVKIEKSIKLPNTVQDIFRLRLFRLDPESLDLLIWAACLGNRFDIDSLAAISKRSTDECRLRLLAAQQIVVPIENQGKFTCDKVFHCFMFVHDQVQQAAYSLISVEERPQMHLKIGRLLLTQLSPGLLAERIFDVVGHLNLGQLLIDKPDEQIKLIELNVIAARKAKLATAYRATFEFHCAAGRVLKDQALLDYLWSNRHELALSLFQAWAESEFIQGDGAEAERHIEQAVAHCKTPIETAEALNILIVQNTLQALYQPAIAAGRQALAALGISLPEQGYEDACAEELKQVRHNLQGRSIAALADLPIMSHPEMRMAVKILIAMGPPCYRSDQKLWGVIVPKVVNLTLQYGNIEHIGYSHPAFAGLLCWVSNDFSSAREFGKVATRLMTEVFHSSSDRCVYALMLGSSVRHWFYPLKQSSADYAEACDIGLQSGNLQYTAYALGHNMYCRFYQGVALDELIPEVQQSLDFSRTRHNQWAIDLLEGGLRIFSFLALPEQQTVPEAEYLAKVEANQNTQVICIYKILKACSLLLLNRCDEALVVSNQVEPILYTVGMQGLLLWPEHVFTRLLIFTGLGSQFEYQPLVAQLRLWAEICPENFEFQYRLVSAELARLERKPTEAMVLYEEAIEGAKAGGFIHWEGLANERAARFWQEQGSNWLTQKYWQQAYICYDHGGFRVKLQAMETEYRQWLAADLPNSSNALIQHLLDQQVLLLRSQHLQDTEAKLQIQVKKQDEEQKLATEYLRTEVAERKRVEKSIIAAKQAAEAEFLKERLLMASIVESSEEAIISKTLDGIITSWNQGAESIFGYTANEIVGQSDRVLTPPDSLCEQEQLLSAIQQDKVFKQHETVRQCKTGQRVEIFATVSPIRDLEGRIIGVSEIAHDITRRKQVEAKLRLAASVFTHAREGIMITAADGKIIDVNNAFTRITGYCPDEVLGQTPHIFSSGRHDQEFFVDMWANLVRKGHWYGEVWNQRKNGEVYVEMLNISAVYDSHHIPQQYVAMFSDITQIKEHEKQLEQIAHYDALTHLPNRVLLSDRLQQAMVNSLRHGRSLAVAYIDLDGFKAINDKYGHEVGDQLLIVVSMRMKKVLREGDTLSRLGGDEFVMVLPELADIEVCTPTLNRLLKAIAQSVHMDNMELHVSASLGVTFYPQLEKMDADQLLRQADQAMYQAKLAGKNRFHVFDTEHDHNVRIYQESIEGIRQAMMDDNFILYYQPKVNMRTGEVIGAEALIRWQHPEKGLLLPATFLPIIEYHPLAITLGEWVIDTALTQMEIWSATGLDIPISVNIGARQLQETGFINRLRGFLAAHSDVRPNQLELEVLETSALEDLLRVSDIIKECQHLGVLFTLDDFGTGYSSLTYLKHLPVSQLKIDQSFVRDMLNNPDDLSILEGVLGLAVAFRRKVVAEGVETAEHGAMLLQLGCDLAQGYGIARPMPASEFPQWVSTWKPDLSWGNLTFISHIDLPLLFASAEHRAWIMSIESYLNDQREAPISLTEHQCRFGLWLDAEDRAGYQEQQSFQRAKVLHVQLHALVTDLCKLHADGQEPQARTRLGELHGLLDKLLEQLKALVY